MQPPDSSTVNTMAGSAGTEDVVVDDTVVDGGVVVVVSAGKSLAEAHPTANNPPTSKAMIPFIFV